MAPSVAHMHSLVAKNTRLFQAAWKHTKRLIEEKLPQSIRNSQTELQPLHLRNAPKQPIHPVAYLRQSKGRWYTTHSTVNAAVRKFTTSAKGLGKFDRASLPKSKIGSTVYASTGRAPFASTLRPNLTGGTLGRTAGGYGWGSGGAGSARFFSHSPAAPAQVVQNVSQAMRAFFVSGQKIQFDGVNPRTGEKKYRAVSSLQEAVGQKISSVPRATPGSFVDFNINPTITALTPLTAVAGFAGASAPKESLNTEGLLDVLSVDFSRALKELSGVLNDLRRLSSLGDLPITYHTTSLRIHFPGCDADTVERMCVELGVQRGIVHQDEDFDSFAGTEIALLFPFAPSKTTSEASFYDRPIEERTIYHNYHEHIDWRNMISSPPSDKQLAMDECSMRSELDLDFEHVNRDGPWLSSPSGYESVNTTDLEPLLPSQDWHSPLEYQGLEGVYKFMEQCEGR